MEVVRTINFINNNKYIEGKISNSIELDYNIRNYITDLFNLIYINNIDYLKSIFLIAYSITSKNIQGEQYQIKVIPEIERKAHTLVEEFMNIIKNISSKKLYKYINNFSEEMDEFVYIYNKYYDTEYKKFINYMKQFSKLLLLYKKEVLDYKSNNLIELQEITEKELNLYYKEITNLISEMYIINPNNTVHTLLIHMPLIRQCDIKIKELNLEKYSWDLIFQNYELDKYNTMYIIITELRKTLSEKLVSAKAKKYIYYNIDIDKLRKYIRTRSLDDIILNNILSIIINAIKMDNKEINIEEGFNSNEKMIFYKLYLIYKTSNTYII
jgi:hypothetical protein